MNEELVQAQFAQVGHQADMFPLIQNNVNYDEIEAEQIVSEILHIEYEAQRVGESQAMDAHDLFAEMPDMMSDQSQVNVITDAQLVHQPIYSVNAPDHQPVYSVNAPDQQQYVTYMYHSTEQPIENASDGQIVVFETEGFSNEELVQGIDSTLDGMETEEGMLLDSETDLPYLSEGNGRTYSFM